MDDLSIEPSNGGSSSFGPSCSKVHDVCNDVCGVLYVSIVDEDGNSVVVGGSPRYAIKSASCVPAGNCSNTKSLSKTPGGTDYGLLWFCTMLLKILDFHKHPFKHSRLG